MVSADVGGPLHAQWAPRNSIDGSKWLLRPYGAVTIILVISRLLKIVTIEVDVMSRGGTPPAPMCRSLAASL